MEDRLQRLKDLQDAYERGERFIDAKESREEEIRKSLPQLSDKFVMAYAVRSLEQLKTYKQGRQKGSKSAKRSGLTPSGPELFDALEDPLLVLCFLLRTAAVQQRTESIGKAVALIIQEGWPYIASRDDDFLTARFLFRALDISLDGKLARKAIKGIMRENQRARRQWGSAVANCVLRILQSFGCDTAIDEFRMIQSLCAYSVPAECMEEKCYFDKNKSCVTLLKRFTHLFRLANDIADDFPETCWSMAYYSIVQMSYICVAHSLSQKKLILNTIDDDLAREYLAAWLTLNLHGLQNLEEYDKPQGPLPVFHSALQAHGLLHVEYAVYLMSSIKADQPYARQNLYMRIEDTCMRYFTLILDGQPKRMNERRRRDYLEHFTKALKVTRDPGDITTGFMNEDAERGSLFQSIVLSAAANLLGKYEFTSNSGKPYCDPELWKSCLQILGNAITKEKKLQDSHQWRPTVQSYNDPFGVELYNRSKEICQRHYLIDMHVGSAALITAEARSLANYACSGVKMPLTPFLGSSTPLMMGQNQREWGGLVRTPLFNLSLDYVRELLHRSTFSVRLCVEILVTSKSDFDVSDASKGLLDLYYLILATDADKSMSDFEILEHPSRKELKENMSCVFQDLDPKILAACLAWCIETLGTNCLFPEAYASLQVMEAILDDTDGSLILTNTIRYIETLQKKDENGAKIVEAIDCLYSVLTGQRVWKPEQISQVLNLCGMVGPGSSRRKMIAVLRLKEGAERLK